MKENIILETIFNRRTIRQYKSTPISKEQIDNLVKAALLSPSSRNEQPWQLGVLTNQATILEWEKDIIQHFIDKKIEWAVKHNASRDNKIFYDAPLVFIISMEDNKAMDVGIMAQTLALAAKGMGLDSVILGLPRVSFDAEYKGKWEERLNFPKDHVYGIAVAIGYANAPGRDREPDYSKVTYLD